MGASIANPYEDFTRTVATTAELLEWMRLGARNARLVSVSSAAVYGAGHTGPIREEQALLPFSPYGYHKLMMENLCLSYAANYGLAVTVVRLFSVYGSWLKKQVLWDMCSSLASGTRQLVLGGTGEELRDWTDIRDVVRALEFAMGLASDPDARRSSTWAREKRRAWAELPRWCWSPGRRQPGLSSMARRGPEIPAVWWRMAGSCRRRVLPGTFP